MATKINKEIYPDVDQDLLEVLRDIYSRYTGYQVAEAIKVIRLELNQQKELQQLDQDISLLLLKQDKLRNSSIDEHQ
jgi:hypothetical protein